MMIQLTRASHTGTLVEGRDRQLIPELHFGADVQEENDDRPPWSWERDMGEGGCWAGQGRGMVASDAPAPGMQEGGSAAGPGLRTAPTFSVCCTSPQHLQRVRSLSPPIWRSCSGRWYLLCPCRRHHPSKSCLCLWGQVNMVSQQICRRAGQKKNSTAVSVLAQGVLGSAGNSQIEWFPPALSTPPRPNTHFLGSVSRGHNNSNCGDGSIYWCLLHGAHSTRVIFLHSQRGPVR